MLPSPSGFGRNVLLQTGIPIEVSADGRPELGFHGYTIDWNTVTALAANYTDQSGIQVPSGTKMLRFGQVLTVASGNASSTVITLINTPTGGTFTLTVVVGNTEQTTTALAYNASTTAVAAAINALAMVSSGATVSGTAGSTYTVNLPAGLGNAGIIANGTALTGAGNPPNVYVSTTPTEGNMVGPFDPAASDGRATLALGSCGILNATVLQAGLLGFTTFNHTNVGLIVGGNVFVNRIIQSGTNTHTLAAGPTWAELTAVMPRLYPVQ